MPTFTSEFYYGLLIGVLFGFMLYYKLHTNKLYGINQKIDKIINLIEPKKRHNNKSRKPFGKRSYLPDVEKLWKNFKSLFDKKAGLDPKFSFNNNKKVSVQKANSPVDLLYENVRNTLT